MTVTVRRSSTCDGPWMGGGVSADAGPAQPKEEAPDLRRGRRQRDRARLGWNSAGPCGE
jgi:hypothetical protein